MQSYKSYIRLVHRHKPTEPTLFLAGNEYFSAIPQWRRAILTALYRDIALLGPPYRGNRTVLLLQ